MEVSYGEYNPLSEDSNNGIDVKVAKGAYLIGSIIITNDKTTKKIQMPVGSYICYEGSFGYSQSEQKIWSETGNFTITKGGITSITIQPHPLE